MKVYLVWNKGNYTTLESLWTTRAGAEAYLHMAAESRSPMGGTLSIEKVTVLELLGEVR